MARFLRVLVKVAVLGGIVAVVVKVLQNRSHPEPVVDRNTYNSWPPLDEKPAPGSAAHKAPTGNDDGPSEAPAKKPVAKKATAKKKAPAKKAAAKKKAPAKKASAPTKRAD